MNDRTSRASEIWATERALAGSRAEIWLKTSKQAADIRDCLANFRELARAEQTLSEPRLAAILTHLLARLPHQPTDDYSQT